MTVHLNQAGIDVNSGTVHPLMGDEGLSGVVRGRNHRTTIPAKDGVRAGDLVTVPLRMALWQRRRHGYIINDGELPHHSDAGSQYLAFRISEELMLEGIPASMGSVG